MTTNYRAEAVEIANGMNAVMAGKPTVAVYLAVAMTLAAIEARAQRPDRARMLQLLGSCMDDILGTPSATSASDATACQVAAMELARREQAVRYVADAVRCGGGGDVETTARCAIDAYDAWKSLYGAPLA